MEIEGSFPILTFTRNFFLTEDQLKMGDDITNNNAGSYLKNKVKVKCW